MTHRFSLPRSLSLLLSVLALWLVVVPAQAQLTGTYLAYGPRGAPTAGIATYFSNWPLSLAECQANTPIRLQLTNAPFMATAMLTFSLWASSGGGATPTACEMGSNRGTGMPPPCTRITTFSEPNVSAVNQEVSIPPQVLFGTDCSQAGDRAFFLMAMASPADISTNVAPTHFMVLRIGLDRTPPMAPTLSDAAGDAATTVRWTNAMDTGLLSSARIYIDPAGTCGAGGDGGTGMSSTLMAGGAAPATAFATIDGGSPTSIAVDTSRIPLAYGASAVMAVTILDQARNESVLSNLACITRVRVSGFWDRYCTERGFDPGTPDGLAACRARYDGCSAVPHRRTAGVWLGLFAVLAALVIRRRS